ncbi:hypothetical protein IAQ61_010742 [Plenodomus lingam]|uniref:uncharacterized protein n=1 Tax=Leptosphaeria maculans TaxID=5022 RepID=UPI003323A030|nr:hypothetical protein IAQ61_010742 [Plenodomus lingam]
MTVSSSVCSSPWCRDSSIEDPRLPVHSHSTHQQVFTRPQKAVWGVSRNHSGNKEEPGTVSAVEGLGDEGNGEWYGECEGWVQASEQHDE